MGEALALIALLLFSANALLVSIVSPRLGQDIGFLLALGTNVAFAGLLLLGQWAFVARPSEVDWSALALFAVGGFFTTYLGRRLFFLTVQSIGPSRATSLQITNPAWAGLISWVFLGETLGPAAVAFVLAVVVGLWLTTRIRRPAAVPAGRAGDGDVVPPDPAADAAADRPRTGLPGREVAVALAGAFAYGVGNVVRSTGVRDWNEPILGGFVGALAGVLAYVLLHVQVRTVAARVREADRAAVWLWGLSGVLTVSAQIATIAATRHIPIAVAVVVSAALPVIVIPVSVLFLHNKEAVSGRTVAGGLLILGGVAGLLLT